MAKKNKEGDSCRHKCILWVTDARRNDIHMPAFQRLDGTPVMRTRADDRRLDEALFHANVNSGSQWEDPANRLPLCDIGRHKKVSEVLSCTIGMRSFDGTFLRSAPC